MIIKLTNGIELKPLSAMGEKRFVQGSSRDTISFVFPAETSLDELDALFTSENCEKIIISDGEEQYIHNAYAIRVELTRKPMEIEPATESTEAIYENRVIITIGQRTYFESQLAAIAQHNTMLEECIVEMAEIVYA